MKFSTKDLPEDSKALINFMRSKVSCDSHTPHKGALIGIYTTGKVIKLIQKRIEKYKNANSPHSKYIPRWECQIIILKGTNVNSKEAMDWLRDNDGVLKSEDNKLYSGDTGADRIKQELNDPDVNPYRTFKVESTECKQ